MCFHISINLYQNFSRGSTKTWKWTQGKNRSG
jgi:hypothetical protein